jgi:cobalt-zinc-cadmium efflux system outer membrane protein
MQRSLLSQLTRASVPLFVAAFCISLGRPAWAEEPVALAPTPPPLQQSPGVPGPAAPIATLLADPNSLVAWLTRMNPDVRAASARVAQASAQVGASRVWQNPTLEAGLNNVAVGRLNRVAPGFSRADALSYSLGVSQTFELGKRGPRSDAAKLHRNASAEEYRGTLLGLVSDARAAMTRVAYLGARQHILEDSLLSAQSMADLTKIRMDRGDVSGVDQSRLVLDAERVERDVADNRSDLQDALADCEALLFAPCQADGATLDAAERSAGGQFAADDVNGAIANRPDLRALRFEQQAASAEGTMFRRNAIPDPTLGVTYTRDYDEAAGAQPHSIGVSASIPLPFFDHGQYQALAADHRSEELSAVLQSVQRHAASDARSLLIRRHVLQEKLENIQKSALPRSKDVVESTTTAYTRGQISMTDLLLARRDHASLLLEEADTRFALFNVENDLRRALGIDQNLVGEKPREDS